MDHVICAVCGYFDAGIDQHHVAGIANFNDVTVPVCKPCHAELHVRLAAHGVELRHDAVRTPLDATRALFVGYCSLLRLHLEYHPNPNMPASLVALVTRHVSRDMDRQESQARPGRWGSDPTVHLEERMPAETREDGDIDMRNLLLACAVDVIDSIKHTPTNDAGEIAAFRVIAADPIAFMRGLERAEIDEWTNSQLLADMQHCMDQISRSLRFIAAHDPDTEWPAEHLAEARLWGQTMRRLLEQLIQLAGLNAQAGR
jgi:hypothetical protein